MSKRTQWAVLADLNASKPNSAGFRIRSRENLFKTLSEAISVGLFVYPRGYEMRHELIRGRITQAICLPDDSITVQVEWNSVLWDTADFRWGTASITVPEVAQNNLRFGIKLDTICCVTAEPIELASDQVTRYMDKDEIRPYMEWAETIRSVQSALGGPVQITAFEKRSGKIKPKFRLRSTGEK